MDINKLKGMNPAQLVAGFILVMMLPLLAVWYKSRKADRNPSALEEMAPVSASSQYETKLAAFKAKQKEQREMAGNMHLNAREMEVVSTPETEVSDESREVEKRTAIQKESDSKTMPVKRHETVTNEVRTASKAAVSNREAVQQLRNTVATSQPSNNSSDSREMPNDQTSLQERRRQEMAASWNRNKTEPSNAGKTFKGVIHGTQELASGQIAQLRTKEEIQVGSIVIPQNTLVSGKVSIVSGRLIIVVSSIRLRNDIVPVSMSVYGSDGQLGLPTALDVRDNAIDKELTQEAISQVRRTGVIGSIASSVASAVTRDKNQRVKLIDSQSIYFKLNVK